MATSSATLADPVPPAGRTRAPRWPLAVFRAVAGVHMLLILAQAAFVGRFLSGDAGALALHERNGTEVLTVVALVQVVAAVLLWRPGRGSALPVAVSVGLFVAEVLQIGYGFSDRLAIHVPLGVAILGTAVALLIGTHAPSPSPGQRGAGVRGTGLAVAVAGFLAAGLAGGVLLDRGPGLEPVALAMALAGGALALGLRRLLAARARRPSQG